MAPIAYTGPGLEAMARLEKILDSTQGVKVTRSIDHYLTAEFTSVVFRLVDDLELLLDPDEGVIHVRSASRMGRWDLGANRRRVENLRRRFGEDRL